MQELPRHEIDSSTAEDLRQLPFQLEDLETEHRPGLEIYQQIDVTLGAKVVPQGRAEERELARARRFLGQEEDGWRLARVPRRRALAVTS